MTNLDSILKSRDITLPTKVCQVRAMVFPVVMYGCESRTIRKDAGGGGLVAKSCLTLVTPWTVACQVPLPLDSPGKNTGVGCHFLLQGIFLTQESNPGLLHCRQSLYQLSYKGSPRKMRAKELILLNCGVGEDSWESPGQPRDQTSPS